MKEEEEGECPVGQEEDDVSKFPLIVVSMKTEEHEDKAPESSQLHHSPNVQQPLHIKEEEEDPQPTHMKEEEDDPQPTHIKEEEDDPQPTYIKEEEDDPHTTNIKEEEDPQPPHMKEEEGECVVGQEEDDVSKFPLTVVSVKTEEHEDKAPESSQLHNSPNVQQPLHIKEEEEDPQPTYIKEEEEDPQPTYIKEEEEDPHIKEEEEDPHMKEEEEGECPVGQEKDDVSKFPLTVVSVKTEEHEDKAPESSQLHHSPNVQRVSAGSHEEEWHTSVGQKELQAPSHIKEEQLHDEDEAQSLQLHHSQSEENRGAELASDDDNDGGLHDRRTDLGPTAARTDWPLTLRNLTVCGRRGRISSRAPHCWIYSP
ncbi:uncharacterized protein [Nerophis lumbriciformis]|uniref:uncharacterized protein isoform X6 n=1 Tax=Nerophis lumbriciformis TaxID=546530 RepID=UPI002ADFAB87|nr:cardiomyopathy-associated protein 5-like isoform X6 [Nerophis lumbriciformis]